MFDTESNSDKYVGISLFKPVAVNPNEDQLESLGIKTENFFPYVNLEKGNVRVDFLCKHESIPFLLKNTYWISEQQPSEKGNLQFIDIYGKSTWATSLKDLKTKNFDNKDGEGVWFDVESARLAYNGEVARGKNEAGLNDFVRSMLQLASFKKGRLDNIENFFKGDFSELQGYMSKAKPVVMALGIENEKYYKLYSKAVQSTYTKRGVEFDITSAQTKIAEVLDRNVSYLKADYGVTPYNWTKYLLPASEESVSVEETLAGVDASTVQQDKMTWE